MAPADNYPQRHVVDPQSVAQPAAAGACSGASAASVHDIFLSHSGKQKGFAKDLYHALRIKGFPTFFDIEHHSLPIADNFPARIFHAASTCKLGVVVLSNEYLSSKWPMLELLALVDAMGPPLNVKILPLFFLVSVRELKNLKKWRRAWVSNGLDVVKCEKCLRVLCSTNGLAHDALSQGQISFTKEIVESICASRALTPREYSINGTDNNILEDEAHIQTRQIIVERFMKMESTQTRASPFMEGFAGPSTSNSVAEYLSSTPHETTCVLGLHGLPGSGKSTLCKSLQKYYEHSSTYAGKSLHLELPSNPTHADVVNTFKELLRLTPSLCLETPVTRIDQVVSLLNSHQISSIPAFIVVDNINCDVAAEAVSEILCHVIGSGSKVFLIARTRDVLQPIIRTLTNSLENRLIDCRFDYVPMPSINEEEATNILLQTVRQGGIRNQNLRDIASQREKIAHVVRNCGFRSGTAHENVEDLIYLPLVLKTMGSLLIRYQDNIDGWRLDQEEFWGSIRLKSLTNYRKEVVKSLIEKSFKESLDKQLQLLFLDVALFLQPSRLHRSSFHESHSTLGLMHGEDVASIEQKVQNLKRLCFIDSVTEHGIFVHDVYMEFAESIRKPAGSILGWDYIIQKQNSCTVPDRQPVVLLEEEEISNGSRLPVRAAILELGEGCERLCLQYLSSLKAVLIRQTKCKSLVTFQVAGLTSLAIIHVTGFAELPLLECQDASLQRVKRLNLVGGFTTPQLLGLRWGNCWLVQCVQSLRSVGHALRSSLSNLACCLGLTNSQLIDVHDVGRAPNFAGMARHFSGLQVLRLEGTGIRKLEDMSSCWPQLQELYVVECWLEVFRLGHLPQLRILHFRDYEENLSTRYARLIPDQSLPTLYRSLSHQLRHRTLPDIYKSSEGWKLKHAHKEKYMLDGKDLLLGCPGLEEVQITSAFFRIKPGSPDSILKPVWRDLQVLELFLIELPSKLPDLSSIAHKLQVLTLIHCQKLECVDLSAGHGFPNLTALTIKQCESVAKVCLGTSTGALPSLRHLCITSVISDLNIVAGSVEDLIDLKNLELGYCFDFTMADVMPLSDHLGKLARLQHLQLSSYWLRTRLPETDDDGVQVSSGDAPATAITILPLGSLAGELKELQLFRLRSVSCLDGIDSLIHLEVLTVRGCSSLEELPSLHGLNHMRYLQIIECEKLKAVPGCDEMRDLKLACFHSCPSLHQLPFNDVHTLQQSHPQLDKLTIEGSSFAIDFIMMRTWIRISKLLRAAALRQFLWFYYNRQVEIERKEAAVLFLQCLLQLVPLDGNGCIDRKEFPKASQWYALSDFELGTEKLQQIMECCELIWGQPVRLQDDTMYDQLKSTELSSSYRSVLDAAQMRYEVKQDAFKILINRKAWADGASLDGLDIRDVESYALASTVRLTDAAL